MIIRSVAVRQGRRALFASAISPWCQRALLSSESTTTSATTTTAAATQSQSSSASLPQQSPLGLPSSSPSPAAAARLANGRPAWGASARDAPDTTAEDYVLLSKLKRKTGKLGAIVEKRYNHAALLQNPPAPKDITLELLLANQTQIGHNTSLWNPANGRYIHGVRAGVHIIALEQTAAHLRRAARVVEEIALRGGLILFVGTRPGQVEIVVRAAELAGGCHLFTKWMAGGITNRDEVLQRSPIRLVNELDEPWETTAKKGFPETDRKTGTVTDEEVDRRLSAHLQKRRPLLPDLVVVLNPVENMVLLHECELATVPTIGIIDTDADPSRVTYAIPANDDSLRSVGVIAGVLGRAGELGQKRRRKMAAQGKVLWKTPADVKEDIIEDEATVGRSGKKNKYSRWIMEGGAIF
ncbi:40S ribosomal protein [Niveomyces insectorum RCEF 264]|uniref:40S ribosomal protein n=1 Tax=Niveomyces insectorum RCEF 264 TaxID=1081102 RepID=A0A167XPW1_9HYPO|nr:40S ribosomal protein [Niveomyces insectorum RCEF 264]